MPKHEHDTDPMILRKKWEAELARALDDADRLTRALSRHDGDSAEATLLRTRIKAVRIELQILRDLNLSDKPQQPPKWSFPVPVAK